MADAYPVYGAGSRTRTHVLEGKVAAVVLLVIGQNALYVKTGLDQTLAYVQFFLYTHGSGRDS